jgi:hypothetical protein
MSAFANIVEESLNFNFGIQIFPHLVQIFQQNPGKSRVDRPPLALWRARVFFPCRLAPVRAAAGWPGARTPRAWAPCGGHEGVGSMPLSPAPAIAPVLVRHALSTGVGPPISATSVALAVCPSGPPVRSACPLRRRQGMLVRGPRL